MCLGIAFHRGGRWVQCGMISENIKHFAGRWRPGRIWNLSDTTLAHGHDHGIFREMTSNSAWLENWIAACAQNLFANCDFSGCFEKWLLCEIAFFLMRRGMWRNVFQIYLSLASPWDASRLGHFAECVRYFYAHCDVVGCVENCGNDRNLFVNCNMFGCVETWAFRGKCPNSTCQRATTFKC